MIVRQLVTTAALVSCALFVSCLPCCGDTHAGDAKQSLQADPLVFTAEGWRALEAGGAFPTIIGGQGSTMMVVGVRAQNVDVCGVILNARLIHSGTQEVIYEVEQERNLSHVSESAAETNDDDGEQGVQLTPCSNVESRCELPVRLELTVTDREGKAATVSRSGTFDCRAPWDLPCDEGNDGGTDAGP